MEIIGKKSQQEDGGGKFTAGTWRYSVQIRIDGESGTTHKLSNKPTVKVDGKTWTVKGNSTIGDTYSMVSADGPEFTIASGEELIFNRYTSFEIPASVVETPISAFSVASGVDGGTKPYTFSKTSGPSWINISEDGTVSGTPTTAADKDTLVIRVTDSSDNYKEIKIQVGITEAKQKEEISELEGTSNISSIAVYGADIKSPTFTVTKGSPAYFNKSMGIWWKKNGDNWEKIPLGGRRRKIYSRNLEIFSSNSY